MSGMLADADRASVSGRPTADGNPAATVEALIRWTYQDQCAGLIEGVDGGYTTDFLLREQSMTAIVGRYIELGGFVDNSSMAWGAVASRAIHADARLVHAAVVGLERKVGALVMLHGRLDSRPDWMPRAILDRRARPVTTRRSGAPGVEYDADEWRRHLPAKLPDPDGRRRPRLVEVAEPEPWRGWAWAVPEMDLPKDKYRRITCGWRMWTEIVIEPSPEVVLSARRIWSAWVEGLRAVEAEIRGMLTGHRLVDMELEAEPWPAIDQHFWLTLAGLRKKNRVDK